MGETWVFEPANGGTGTLPTQQRPDVKVASSRVVYESDLISGNGVSVAE
jgi:hypothetical protein